MAIVANYREVNYRGIVSKVYDVDKNGVTLRHGDIVEITGGYFKRDNGLWIIAHAPGDEGWSGTYCLHRLNKNGTLSKSKDNIEFWPLETCVSNYMKTLEARAHNAEHAQIEVIKPATNPAETANDEPKEELAAEETAPVQPAEQAQEAESVVESVVESAEAPVETEDEPIPESAGEIPERNIDQTTITHYEDLTGKKFGTLTVMGLKGVINSRRIWRCVCDCGNLREIREDSLKKYTRSCGDPRHRNPNSTKIIHGQSKTRLYNIWRGMKDRCFNPNGSGYEYYGERGITVCDEWTKNFQSFYEWATQNGYSDDLSIDRINTNGNYEPSNCRWATAKEQRLNQRQKEITYNGETHTLLEWSEITGIKYATLIWRYHQNWSADKILSPDNFDEDTKFKAKSYKK